MAIYNREAFLDHLSEKLGTPRHQKDKEPFTHINQLPEETLADLSADELLEMARNTSEALKVTFKVTSKADLGGVLDAYLTDKGDGQLILPTAPDKIKAYGLDDWTAAASNQRTVKYWDPKADRATNLATAQDSAMAIGFGDYMLAESGTITVPSSPGQGRAFNFLPTHYLCIVKRSNILPRSTQATKLYAQRLKSGELKTSNINYISGPSNSGDIEMVLIVGVHGPLDMTYIVVDDM
ncbi:lactate utilization protein C [Agrilactobacillus yilanensis]|uniref:Lactate utilization protein C n=1 Tax=Agrilactobacillus yilanensis TaxID=2485997 RepID=A0ABW4J7N1_9LACO|nr:lactate utilization protein C [Agrilactobacillus yilanensis]